MRRHRRDDLLAEQSLGETIPVDLWSRIGVRAKLRTLPVVTYFSMLQRYEASIYMLGWGVPTFDALFSLQSLVRTVGTGGDGTYNVGRYSLGCPAGKSSLSA